MSDAELEGRLAALELIAAYGLRAAGYGWFGSLYNQKIESELTESIAQTAAALSPEAAASAEAALRRMFERSGSETLHPL